MEHNVIILKRTFIDFSCLLITLSSFWVVCPGLTVFLGGVLTNNSSTCLTIEIIGGGGGGGGGDWLRWWRGVPRGRSDHSKSGDYCNVQLTWHSECQPRQYLQTNTDINEPCTTSLLTCSYPLGRNQMTISWSDLLYWGPARGWRAVIPRLQGWWVRSKKFKLCRSLEVLLCCLN